MCRLFHRPRSLKPPPLAILQIKYKQYCILLGQVSSKRVSFISSHMVWLRYPLFYDSSYEINRGPQLDNRTDINKIN